MNVWFTALRVRQWNKQALIMLPLIALGEAIQILDLFQLILLAFSFSLIASAVYIFNDLQDLLQDRLDPIKSKRPLAVGDISTSHVKIVGPMLVFFGLIIPLTTLVGAIRTNVLSLMLIYLISNLLYSRYHLKRIRILGLVIVALGFAIRFAIGTTVLDLDFSSWAFVLIIQLSMFMLSGKRFQTILRGKTLEDDENGLRFWLLSMVTFAAFFAATYSGFITDPEVVSIWGKEALIASVLPLGIGLVRFVELVTHSKNYLESDVTESMTKDPFLIFLVLTFTLTLYLGRLNA
jgi:decaprenyl-phosphate phosphoribosyltransferase